MPVIHSFPFTAVDLETGKAFRPLLHVRLRGPSGAVDEAMLLDSGADSSLISLATSKSLGLELGEPHGGRGASGRFPVRRARMTVEIRYGVGWMDPITVPVDVPIRGAPPFPALGREGVFDVYDILFRLGPEQARGMFHLISHEESGRRRVLPTASPRGASRRKVLAG
jgi:hypothetical protein